MIGVTGFAGFITGFGAIGVIGGAAGTPSGSPSVGAGTGAGAGRGAGFLFTGLATLLFTGAVPGLFAGFAFIEVMRPGFPLLETLLFTDAGLAFTDGLREVTRPGFVLTEVFFFATL